MVEQSLSQLVMIKLKSMKMLISAHPSATGIGRLSGLALLLFLLHPKLCLLSPFILLFLICFFSDACNATLHLVWSFRPSIGPSYFYFFMIFIVWHHCSCPDGLVTANMAPTHPYVTSKRPDITSGNSPLCPTGLALWSRCPALTQLLQLITTSRTLGTTDHVQSLDDFLKFDP